MILDYRNFSAASGTKGLVNYEYVNSLGNPFFSMDGFCPVCSIVADIVHEKNKNDTPEWLFGSYDQYETVISCPNCGWWEYKLTGTSDAILDGIRATTIDVKSAVLKKYNVADKDVPISILRDYISKNPDKIHGIHTGKMEELVQSVFASFYACEVKRIGQSHDGGVDLFLVIGDIQTAVQVKRRINPDHTEAVSGVRELVGSALLKDAEACIFVSTADHFSHEAVKAAVEFEKRQIVKKYDLFDFESFVDMMGFRYTAPEPPWAVHVTL